MKPRLPSDKRWLSIQEAAALVVFSDRKLVGIPSVRDAIVEHVARLVYSMHGWADINDLPHGILDPNRALINEAGLRAHSAARQVDIRNVGKDPEKIARQGLPVDLRNYALTFA